MPQLIITKKDSQLVKEFQSNRKKEFTPDEKARVEVLLKLLGNGTLLDTKIAEDRIKAFTGRPILYDINFTELQQFISQSKPISKSPDYVLAVRIYLGMDGQKNYNLVVVPTISLKGTKKQHEKDLEKTVFKLTTTDFFALNTAKPLANRLDKSISNCKAAILQTDPSGVKLVFYTIENLEKFIAGVKGQVSALRLQFAIDNKPASSTEPAKNDLTIILSLLDAAGKQLPSTMKVNNVDLATTGVYFDDGDRIPPPPPKGSGTAIDDSHFN